MLNTRKKKCSRYETECVDLIGFGGKPKQKVKYNINISMDVLNMTLLCVNFSYVQASCCQNP